MSLSLSEIQEREDLHERHLAMQQRVNFYLCKLDGLLVGAGLNHQEGRAAHSLVRGIVAHAVRLGHLSRQLMACGDFPDYCGWDFFEQFAWNEDGRDA